MGSKKVKLITSAILLELGMAPLQAATINVDNNTCVLADAITAANTDTATNGCDAGSGADEIVLPQDSTITLTEELPSVSSEVTLQGNGSTIERDSQAVEEFRVLNVTDGGPGPGPVPARGVVGPAIASLTVSDVTISGGVDSGNSGAGILCGGAANTLVVTNSTITNNQGSGILSYDCALTVNNSVISNNTSFNDDYYGAGVNVNAGTFYITNTSITGNNNQAANAGGGGIYLTDYSGFIAGSIQNTTVSGNTADLSGGGIGFFNFGNGATFSITNSTISDNQTTNGDGGGVFLYAPSVDMRSNTISGNSAYASGGGIAVRDNAFLSLAQNIVSGNNASADGDEVDFAGGGSVIVDQFNLFGQNGMPGLNGITAGLTDIVPSVGVSAIISPLADNGGPTQTHALAVGSPAIDAVGSGAFCLGTDQRGVARPIDGDSDGDPLCDIGSYETQDLDLIFKNGFD